MKNLNKAGRNLLALLCMSVVVSTTSFGQDTLTVMTYNLLNYNIADLSRDNFFRTVVQAANPDILVIQEVTSLEAVNNFLKNVLNAAVPDAYVAGTFIDGPDTDNAAFYKPNKITFIGNSPIKTALRDISEFKLVHSTSAETLRVYSVHLKASNTASDQQKRAAEVDLLRQKTNQLPQNSNFVVVGDYNIYTSSEPAHTKFLQSSPESDGEFIDPLSLPGIWNDPKYAIYHTQSTRTRSFGGGATGGLDDRFDMIMFSKAVNEPGGVEFVKGSYMVIGNDGNHYNDSINRLPNLAVSVDVANALHYASDHLPVLARFVFGSPLTSVNTEIGEVSSFELSQNYPNPFNPSTTISFILPFSGHVRLLIFNTLGERVATLFDQHIEAGRYSVKWDAGKFASGAYYYRLQSGSTVKQRKLVLLR